MKWTPMAETKIHQRHTLRRMSDLRAKKEQKNDRSTMLKMKF